MDQLFNIKTGLIGKSSEIVSMLRQEGIPFFEHDSLGSGKLNDRESILIISKVGGRDIKPLKDHLFKGGAIICDRLNKDLVSCMRVKRMDFDDSIYRGYIECYESSGGYIVYINKYLFKEIDDKRAVIKEFFTSAGIVREKVALFPKYRDREILSRALMASFHIRSLPFVRLWYYPKAQRSVFSFRFDLDEDTDNDLEHIAEASMQFKDCTTWFVSCASFERNIYKIKKLIDDGFDVQSHGYYHHTYGDSGQNEVNINKSINYINSLHGSVEGFAAPMGRWNEGLQAVLERLGFLYSSEFSLDYDNFPFYPIMHGRISSILQIPIHPICWGIYKDAGIEDNEAIREYMQKVVIKKYDARLPILIYGHPSESIGKEPKLLEAIYGIVDPLPKLWRAKFSDLAKWWNKRDKVRFKNLIFNASKRTFSYVLEDGTDFSDLYLNIKIHTDQISYYGIDGLSGNVRLNELRYETSRYLKADPDLYRESVWKKTRLKKLKEGLVDMLDWEERTPLSEIKRNSLASNLKYILRRCGFDKVKLNV